MGRSIAELFASEGAAVVVSGRSERRGSETVESIRATGGRAIFLAGDISEEAVNRRLVELALSEFGGLNILVPNAGELGLASITEIEPDQWHRTLATNLHAVFYLLHHGIPEILKGGSGSIVVTGSIAAYKAFPNHVAYCTSKGALIPLIRQVAVDYSPSVRANILCPGPVDTPLIWDSAKAFPDPEKAVSDVAEKTLLKRLGLPLDIAQAALFLASDESSWITGSALTIDGGIMCV
jgi:NAD(P)-dependent dehydrogenase (short-subunit alcohol dehydrogenase family)